ncbi:Gp37-like protein [Dietzia maris]|uniref:Gp37-like protein n=1 Tax=Dietzia maris TaxID=37915 RepID=UPI0037C59D90
MSDWSAERLATTAAGGVVMKLLDRHIEPVDDLHGFFEWEGPEVPNEEATFVGSYPVNHPVVDTLIPLGSLDPSKPEDTWTELIHAAQWVLIETGQDPVTGKPHRLFYRVMRITDGHGSKRARVKIEAVSLHRYAAHITFQASPGFPIIAQPKYRDIRAGQSLKVIKEYFLVNTMREFQPGAIDGWDLWAPESWENVVADQWACIVNPINAPVTTAMTILDMRFDSGLAAVKETLDAAGLLLTLDVWLEGDPQPFPDHTILTKPTIVLDIVPRQWDTSTTGHAGDLLKGLIRTFDTEANAPRIGLADTPSTAAGVPAWVLWQPEHMEAVTSELTIAKSDVWHVTVGGRSPEAINNMLGLGAKAIFGGLGAALAMAIPVFGPVIVAAADFLGDVVGESLKDKLFAWSEAADLKRKEWHGRFANRDSVGAGDGWTIEAYQQAYQMLAQGAGGISIGFTVDGRAPFQWGTDYRAGDQQGVVHRGIIFATYASKTVISQKKGDKRIRSAIELGDPRVRENPTALFARSIKSIQNAVDRVKTFIM